MEENRIFDLVLVKYGRFLVNYGHILVNCGRFLEIFGIDVEYIPGYTIYVISLSSMYWNIPVQTSTCFTLPVASGRRHDMIQGSTCRNVLSHEKACNSTSILRIYLLVLPCPGVLDSKRNDHRLP
jgi:hypothetical protein